MNGEPCFYVNFRRPLILLVTLVFWNVTAFPQETTLKILRQYEDISLKLGYSCIFVTVFVCFIAIDLAFSELFVNFNFVQIFSSCCFSYGNDETQIQNSLILLRTPNRQCFLYESKISEFKSHHLLWLYVPIMPRTRLRVNPHSIVSWMSRNSLLETGAISKV